MYKPHNAKLDFYYMNIAAFVIFGALSAWACWSYLGSGGKYFLLDRFGISSAGTVTKVAKRENKSINTWGHLPFEEYLSSEYFFKYTDKSGISHENSVFLLDEFIENKFWKKNGEPRFERKNFYKIGQTEEVKYLENWPAVFLPVSCLPPLAFDMKILFISFLMLSILVSLLIWNIWALRKFQLSSKRY